MSASFHWIAWKSPMRCAELLALQRVVRAPRRTPPARFRAPAPRSRSARRRASPWRRGSRAPPRAAGDRAPTRASSIARSEVVDELRPSFSSSRVTRTCSASRTKHETPRAPAVAGSVRANSTNVPARDPFVIHCFEPFSTHSSPSASAVVRSEPASEPDAGLRERERAELLAARERRHEAGALLVGPERENRQRRRRSCAPRR